MIRAVELHRRRSLSSYGGIFDDVSSSISRGVNDGITNALPGVQAAISETVRNAANSVFPDLQNRMKTALRDGINEGTGNVRDLLASSSGIAPGIAAGIKTGVSAGVDQYKRTILIVGIVLGGVALVATAAAAVTAYQSVRCCRR